jgi:hypothetical protein
MFKRSAGRRANLGLSYSNIQQCGCYLQRSTGESSRQLQTGSYYAHRRCGNPLQTVNVTLQRTAYTKKNNYLTCISKTLEHYARSHHPQEHDDDDLIACPSDHWPVSYIAINDHD